ncbi:MAG: hypothetical protein ACI4E5_06710 [Suilimivivens sp.]|nr:hypothetical protein [Lachnospiraceae bacterium]
MTIEKVLEMAGIPLMVFAVCTYYGIRLIVSRDIGPIQNKSKRIIKNEKEYALEAGRLILFYGAATLAMAILLLINVYVAVAEIVICTIIMGLLWKKMNKKYSI